MTIVSTRWLLLFREMVAVLLAAVCGTQQVIFCLDKMRNVLILNLEVHIITGVSYMFLKCHWRQDRQAAGRNFQMHLRRYSGFC